MFSKHSDAGNDDGDGDEERRGCAHLEPKVGRSGGSLSQGYSTTPDGAAE